MSLTHVPFAGFFNRLVLLFFAVVARRRVALLVGTTHDPAQPETLRVDGIDCAAGSEFVDDRLRLQE